LMVLFALAGCSPQPVAGETSTQAKTKPAPSVSDSARDWCETFEYREGTAAWDACVSRWRRNLARHD
jgi:hypothetical protein